ncbi:class I SAM-dependent methyltransferase [Saccharothrix coeruleofusca]|uniref:Methyltransferase n=1 Tax=Saccharothrix coeruleofusca TaxID=33919 RepID=A0A918ANT1_9PSEU|nr:class I SAM-dependent methyltransferase [Saccharothrix coeruleofusca]MBP2338063.1 SAM-dependent methyltransferase [Saccharothrix coeruleofusca]GGP50989.1 methyltransferase [Saccharothrix coeruleofusca]
MAEPSFLNAIRQSYDAVAEDYVRIVAPPERMDPLTRAMLAAFADLVRAADRGPVADVGCGPGRVTAHLDSLGLSAFGVDLSPRMVELARTTHPHLPFSVGSMTALDLDDGSLGGVLALFSTFHTPPEHLPTVFAEFHRTLAPGGHLMLWGYVGDHEVLRPTRAYGGHPVSYEAHLLPVERIAELLGEAGLVVTARLVCEPAGKARWPSACFFAHKPDRS